MATKGKMSALKVMGADEKISKANKSKDIDLEDNRGINKQKAKALYKFDYIDTQLIEANELNKRYDQNAIDELRQSIEERGLYHNIVVKDTGKTKKINNKEYSIYRLISGERRYNAISQIRQEDESKYEALFPSGIPAKIIAAGGSKVDEEIDLIQANRETRTITPQQNLSDVIRLIELYKEKEEPNIVKMLSEKLNMSERQARKYSNIEKNLIPELTEAFDKNLISFENASLYAQLSVPEQTALAEILDEYNEITREEYEAIKSSGEERKEKLEKLLAEKEKQEEEINAITAQIARLQEKSANETDEVKKEMIQNLAEEKQKKNETLKQKAKETNKEIVKANKISREEIREEKRKKNIEKTIKSLENISKFMEKNYAFLKNNEAYENDIDMIESYINQLQKYI